MEIRDTRNGEWHWVYNALLADPHLTAGEKLVYSSISTFGGHQVIHPTKEQLAERCAMDGKTVQRAIKRLEEVGYISLDQSVGRGNANVYYLLKKPNGCNLCPFTKGDIQDHKRGHLEPEKGTKTTPYIDKIDKIDTSEAELRIEFDPSEETNTERVVKGKPKYPNAREVFSWFPDPQPSWKIDTTQLKHAELLWERGEKKVRGALAFVAKHKGIEFFPKITKPSDLERKWVDLAAYEPR